MQFLETLFQFEKKKIVSHIKKLKKKPQNKLKPLSLLTYLSLDIMFVSV